MMWLRDRLQKSYFFLIQQSNWHIEIKLLTHIDQQLDIKRSRL